MQIAIPRSRSVDLLTPSISIHTSVGNGSGQPPGPRTPSPLAPADEAFSRADWLTARDLYRAALTEEPSDPDVLDRLGQAEWWVGNLSDAVGLRTQAYAHYVRRGHREDAARVALWIAGEGGGGPAVANGWLARAERMLEAVPRGVQHGWLEVRRAKWSKDPEIAGRHAAEALQSAHDVGDPDLEIGALCQVGLAQIAQGRVQEGMTSLDEAMAAAMAGEAQGPWAVSEVCCQMLVACDRLSDLDRAAEWCRKLIDFTEQNRFTPLTGPCRAIYAGVLTSMGDWERAEAELLAGWQERW